MPAENGSGVPEGLIPIVAGGPRPQAKPTPAKIKRYLIKRAESEDPLLGRTTCGADMVAQRMFELALDEARNTKTGVRGGVPHNVQLAACREIMDRLDGKITESIEVGFPERTLVIDQKSMRSNGNGKLLEG